MSTALGPPSDTKLTLYNCINSDCSTRLRLALSLKDLAYRNVDCGSPFEHADRPSAYTRLNPTNAVPTLVVESATESYAIIQSVAAIEYLDEVWPAPTPLLPSTALARARVRALTAAIASDTHPLTAPRVARQLAVQFGEGNEGERAQGFKPWTRHWVRTGLEAYESMLGSEAFRPGKFSEGDQISMADVCLIVQVWRARSEGLDVDDLSRVKAIVETVESLDGVLSVHWDSNIQGK